MSVFARSSVDEGAITIGVVTAEICRADLEALSFAIDYLEALFLVSDKVAATTIPQSIIAASKWDHIKIQESGAYTFSLRGIQWDVTRTGVLTLRTLLRDILIQNEDLPQLAIAA